MPANHNTPHTEATKRKMSLSKTGKPCIWNRRPSKTKKGITLWRCGTCGKYFPVDGFYKTGLGVLGITNSCRRCHCDTAIRTRCKKTKNTYNRLSEAKRRAQKAGSSGHVSQSALLELENRFGSLCLRCGVSNNLQWDHVMPLSKGGRHCITNLQRLCGGCNVKKYTSSSDYRTKAQKAFACTFKRIK